MVEVEQVEIRKKVDLFVVARECLDCEKTLNEIEQKEQEKRSLLDQKHVDLVEMSRLGGTRWREVD